MVRSPSDHSSSVSGDCELQGHLRLTWFPVLQLPVEDDIDLSDVELDDLEKDEL